MMNRADMAAALRRRLLALRDPATGVWTGRLSTSALATALAVAVLRDSGTAGDARLAARGIAWLTSHVNDDGAWGDSPGSVSNLSATLMVAAVMRKAHPAAECLARADRWIAQQIGCAATPASVSKALRAAYGADRTFAVPILSFLAMSEKTPGAWGSVPPLPFMLALLPSRFFSSVRLPVVSYAVPALIAVGLCRHISAAKERRRWSWGKLFAGPLLSRLARLQPSHGGFLDAVPLTAFVCLSLRSAGYAEHRVVEGAVRFLRESVRPDGGWPIDSNLRTWVTSLAAGAVWPADVIREGGWKRESGGVEDAEQVATWLVKVQTKACHPYTGAAPGGWAWTDLPGGVPDADDTSAALIALKRLKAFGCRTDVSVAVRSGLRWLVRIQNADGGMPTFCRGWGRLPFDRSCADVSAAALAALALWADVLPVLPRSMSRLVLYLKRAQATDGCWHALWFGHQEAEDGRNPVIGTARVVLALRTALGARVLGEQAGVAAELLAKGENWLASRQRADGSWGMGSAPTVEETSLAVSALGGAVAFEASARGVEWLLARGESGVGQAAPIGLYFARLWYYEELYPLIWTLQALGQRA